MRHLITLTIFSLLLTTGCINKEKSENDNKSFAISGVLSDEALLADTITYPVTIFNFDPTDDWSEQRLRNVQRQKLVEEVFNAIYSKTLTVYHYYSDEPLSINDIRELEASPDFSRDRIEEIQFVETWHFSPELKQFQKKVHSIVLAYALYNDDGSRRGLKAAFRIKLNDLD